MKQALILLSLCSILTACGQCGQCGPCGHVDPCMTCPACGYGQIEPVGKALNGWTVNASVEREIKQAVWAEQTLYPYHFEANSAKLSGIGQENVQMLAELYRTDGGELSIRRDGASEALYRKRVETVKQTLGSLGVNASRMKFVERPPLGEGMYSSDVIKILKQKPTDYSDDYGQPIIQNIVPENSQ